MRHQQILMGQGLRSRSVRIIRCVHQVYVQLFSEITVTRVAHLEEISRVVHQGCFEYHLHRIRYDAHENTPWFHALLNLTHRLMKEILRLKHVVQREIITHYVILSIWTSEYITVVKVYPTL